jgi:hypothetical protein
MVDRDANRALLKRAYSNNIRRYQKLLRTHVTDLERDYIKQRLSVYHAAVEALVGPAPWTETKDHLVSLTEHSGNRQAAGRLVTRCCRASPRHPSEPAFSGRAVRSVAASFL